MSLAQIKVLGGRVRAAPAQIWARDVPHPPSQLQACAFDNVSLACRAAAAPFRCNLTSTITSTGANAVGACADLQASVVCVYEEAFSVAFAWQSNQGILTASVFKACKTPTLSLTCLHSGQMGQSGTRLSCMKCHKARVKTRQGVQGLVTHWRMRRQ